MPESADPVGPPTPPADREASRGRHLRYAAGWLAGAVPVFVMITALWLAFPTFGSTGTITVGAFALAFPVVVRRLGVPRRASFIWFMLFAGLAFAVVSILTSWGNGLTDEPFTTPRFVTLIWAHQDPYVTPLNFYYVQYGTRYYSHSIYPYLPLLMFLQIPFLSYKWFALACWAGMVLLVRNRFDAGVLVAQPYFAVMAASGYNDFPVLLLLTVGFVGFAGRRQRWAELLSLGAKQFANAIVILYYLVRRDWKNVLVTLGVSAAFILPFVVWSGPLALCSSVFANRLAACPNGGSAQYLLNYSVWPAWALAIFYPAIVRATRTSAENGRLARRLKGRAFNVERLLRIPSFAIVAAAGALAAVSVFLGVGISLGGSLGPSLVAAVAGFGVLAGWVELMDGVRGAPNRFLGHKLRASSFHTLVLALALIVNIAVVAALFPAGVPSLTGEIVGASCASTAMSGLLFLATVPPRAGG